jgi:hypothetical protein
LCGYASGLQYRIADFAATLPAADESAIVAAMADQAEVELLHRGVPSIAAGRRFAALAPWYCVLMHCAALALLASVLRLGTPAESIVAERARHIHEHAALWRAGWITWMLAATSIVAFYAWWAARSGPQQAAKYAVLIAAAGMACDFLGESILAFVLVDRAALVASQATSAMPTAAASAVESFLSAERVATLLTAGLANLLYTLGGIVLTLGTPGLPAWVRVAMWMTWLAGLLMSVAAAIGSVPGIVVTTTVLFPLLIVWVTWMGGCWRRT